MLNKEYAGFKVFFETLKKISFSSAHGCSLTESELCAVNFDRFTKSMYKRQNFPASNDALLLTEYYNYFMEFKGGKQENVEKEHEQLHKKNVDSVRTLIDKAGEREENIKIKYVYILVYIPEEEPKMGIGASLGSLAEERFFAFGLDAFIGSTFLDVHTISVENFNNDFIPQHFPLSP